MEIVYIGPNDAAAATGHADDRYGWPILLQGSDQFEAVEFRHQNTGNDEIGDSPLDDSQTLPAVLQQRTPMSGAFDALSNE